VAEAVAARGRRQRHKGEPRRPLELDPARVARQRPHHAVVDIGSNSVRLVVYDELGRAPFPRFNEKSFCRLGEGLQQTGRLSEASFARTVDACRRFRAICDAMAVARIDVLATEAVRSASNGQALIAAIADAAGFEVRLLTGAEEARFAGLGVISGFYRPIGLVGDLGGGSLEVIEVLDDRVGERDVSPCRPCWPRMAAAPASGSMRCSPSACRRA
jgi:exopolyphosphatase / guanosine-5'-triphosphate,3'-diphosphate pyrophosphatase